MLQRDKFCFPDYYSFGIEIEMNNKSTSDILDICKNDERLLNVNQPYGEMCDMFGICYANDMFRRYKVALKNNPYKYWGVVPEELGINGEFGAEMFSPVLYNTTEDLNSIREMLNILKKSGADVNEICGLHVHIGSAPFRKKYQKLLNFFLFHILFEPVYYKLSAMGNFGHVREYAMAYANPVSRSISFDEINEDGLKKYIKENSSSSHKEGALHFKNFWIDDFGYGSSFESRVFNCSLESCVVENYIDAVLAGVYYSVSEKFDQGKMIRRCEEAINLRKDWFGFRPFVDYADKLVDEFAEKVFTDKLAKDLFYKQYDGEYLEKNYAYKKI